MPKPTDIIEETQSLCPLCLETLPAAIYESERQVYMHKVCPQHGEFNVYLWPDVDYYRWFTRFVFTATPRAPQTESVSGCPHDCGLCSRHKRHTTLAEIEVTWRCNLACPVCFMSSGDIPPDPTLETIAKIFESVRRFDGQDTSIQLTGGEPTIRTDLPDIIALGRQSGFTAIEVNTNGLVIAHDRNYLHALKEAGVSGIYLQFDGVTAEVTRILRGADLLTSKLQAIENCRAESVPVVLAATIVRGINDGQLGDLITFAMNNLDVICGLALQPAFESGRFDVSAQGNRLSLGDVANLVAEQTGGRIAARDFWPLGCSHPLCSCATYLLGNADNYVPFTRHIDEDAYRTYFDRKSPQGSVFADILSKHQRGGSPRGLSVLMMGYMDAWTIDLNRTQECSMTVATPDGCSIPFCTYHLTDVNGRRLYSPGHGRVSTVGYSQG